MCVIGGIVEAGHGHPLDYGLVPVESRPQAEQRAPQVCPREGACVNQLQVPGIGNAEVSGSGPMHPQCGYAIERIGHPTTLSSERDALALPI